MSGVVDWGLAERAASGVIAGLPRLGGATAVSSRESDWMLAETCARAVDDVAAYSGLGALERPPVPEAVGRREWALNALATFAAATGPLESKLADELRLPGPLGPLARRGVGGALGLEVGVAAGYAARHVLGQYDVAILGPPRPARLLFITENLEDIRRKLGAERGLFVRWIALHECTHVLQFGRVEWLAPHLRDLASRLRSGMAEGISGGELARRLPRDPRELARAVLRGELARALAGPSQRALLDQLQATMAVVEGHAEHVMDAAAAGEPGLAELRLRLDRRRADRGGLSDLIARLLGLDLKLRQYTLGKAFWDTVVDQAGSQVLQTVWATPENLPDLDELGEPRRWLDRVAIPA